MPPFRGSPVASLADIGYEVNLDAADAYRVPFHRNGEACVAATRARMHRP